MDSLQIIAPKTPSIASAKKTSKKQQSTLPTLLSDESFDSDSDFSHINPSDALHWKGDNYSAAIDKKFAPIAALSIFSFYRALFMLFFLGIFFFLYYHPNIWKPYVQTFFSSNNTSSKTSNSKNTSDTSSNNTSKTSNSNNLSNTKKISTATGDVAKTSMAASQRIESEVEQRQQTALDRALDDAGAHPPTEEVLPHSANDGDKGWCFLGTDNGFRICAPVGANDMCMSGDIFPSQTICMNPNLRA
jgi:hypothetical protein